MQGRTNSLRTTFRSRFFLFVLVSVCLLSAGAKRGASGIVGMVTSVESSTTQDPKSGDGIWGVVDRTALKPRVESASPGAYHVVELHEEALVRALSNAPMEFTDAAKTAKAHITLPMPEGNLARFQIEESPVMEPALAVQFPEVKSYRGQGLDDPTATARLDWGPNGFNAMVISTSGSAFVAPYTADDKHNYISFYKEDLQQGFQPPQCEVTEAMQELRDGLANKFGPDGFAPNASVGATLRTYRLALATTVEYTNNATYGGTKASTLTKLNTIVNLINAIYEREVSIRFQLVASELSIIFDTEPDGYTNSSVGTMLNENTTVLNATIGSGAYDIGHVFGLSSAGSSSGVAQLAVVCGGSKGRGASVLGIALVTGNFAIDSGLVTHEWGHQFSASHTFNSTSNFCGSAGQRSASTAFEPGSGSTLMAYPGSCSPENLQSNSDSYFMGGSFDQIASFSAGAANPCASPTATGNNPPVVSAGLDYTVPMGTPFTLTATGNDPDGDSLTYSWEELDTGAASPPMTDDGTRPLFRSLPAVVSNSRTFPKLSSILNNTSTIGETLPITTRAMNFRVTARDNRAAGGGVNSDAMILNVNAASGPFVVTQPNTAVSWTGGSSQTVTWNAANTSNPPVNCALVKLSLSTDGGNTFPNVLAASTPNDGAETVVIPNISTTTARVKVEALANVFFDVSNTNFTVTPGGGSIQVTVQTNPGGRSFTVDGTTFNAAQSFSWTPGSNHTIATSTTQSGAAGTQYVWNNWSDGGAISHTVAPTVPATFTANFTTQFFLTVSAGAGGTASPSSNWFNSGQNVPITATPNGGFVFSGWTGSGSGSFTGMTNPASVTMNGPITEVASFTNSASAHVSTVGLYFPSNAGFYLRNSNTTGGADITFSYGPAGLGWLPLVGDWNGDGTDTAGLYNPANSTFYLRNSNSIGFADITFSYGPPGQNWIPVTGDWNGDGVDTVGLYNPANGVFYLRNTNSVGVADVTFSYGPVGQGWIPIARDWNGDGADTIGLYNPSNSAFYLRNSNTVGNADAIVTFGPAGSGWTPLVGDWDGDGVDTIGLYNPSNGAFYLRNSNTFGGADVVLTYGPANAGWKPIVGDWDGL